MCTGLCRVKSPGVRGESWKGWSGWGAQGRGESMHRAACRKGGMQSLGQGESACEVASQVGAMSERAWCCGQAASDPRGGDIQRVPQRKGHTERAIQQPVGGR